jgi:hypothetical protein
MVISGGAGSVDPQLAALSSPAAETMVETARAARASHELRKCATARMAH